MTDRKVRMDGQKTARTDRKVRMDGQKTAITDRKVRRRKKDQE